MYKNNLESSLIDMLIKYYDSHYHQPLVFEWNDGTQIKANIETFYETDNGLELDEKEYEEFHACAIRVDEILYLPDVLKGSIVWPEKKEEIKKDTLTEITYHNAPDKISNIDGILLWDKIAIYD